ncbi:uncharacterized protein LOC144574588 [Carex rostrata]
MASLQAWIAEHKLTSIGAFWATSVGASCVYNAKTTPLKPSLRLIHARIHAQALTLAVLSGAAVLHYYNTNNGDADIRSNRNNNNESSHSLSFDEEERLSWWI